MSPSYDYQAQKQRLLEHPEEIINEWTTGQGMFKFLRPDITYMSRGIGCVSIIKNQEESYPGIGRDFLGETTFDKELGDRIKADPRLPILGKTGPRELTAEQMDAFIEYCVEYDNKYLVPQE